MAASERVLTILWPGDCLTLFVRLGEQNLSDLFVFFQTVIVPLRRVADPREVHVFRVVRQFDCASDGIRSGAFGGVESGLAWPLGQCVDGIDDFFGESFSREV